MTIQNSKFKIQNSNERGQSLFEIVIALAVSAIIIVALVALVSNSIRNTTFSKNKTLAGRFAQEATEWLRAQRDADIDSFRSKVATPTWCFKELNWTRQGSCGQGDEISQTPLKREVNFTSSVVSGKTLISADIKVSWSDSQGFHEVRSSTNFTDWRQR